MEAVQREVLEETGVRMEVDRLAFIHENFFRDTETAALHGRQCHEVAFYFLMKYDASMKLSTEPSRTTVGDVEWHEWVPISQCGVKAVMYPSFFVDELASIGGDPKWITSRD